ncbi:glutamate/tyrosine decarboxylase-like PLP-dependent enzyme [Archangium gephyra]|uniref:Aromatic-L-amino-acid decarboxylase n=1 Tax=Archangium gephyra TaxID=48 RepID=A0AAC8QEC7_9BACT|nr:aminotransferase class V-fold PLP-dependent enzyme [Archangium gephyra]AKJ05894.1 Aromatic-L-amino-acid decarboxylase [Archangium gephyra]REG27352.1 glutamate/tyrosine decarboxylase-like PLP-dependent enzyme [Archangium gephyra]
MTSLELTTDDFRRLAHRVSTLAEQWLTELDARAIAPALKGSDTEALFAEGLPEEGLKDAALDALGTVIAGTRAGNARFLGYVLGSGEPVGALGDYLASVLNQNVTAWRSSPTMVSMERAVVRGLAAAVGCPGFTGSLTGGGSSANLMGLTMAREAKAPANEEGSPSGVVYASTEVHMSIPKALALLGLGRRNLRLIPTDSDWRMRPEALEHAITGDVAAGRRPLAVVATAGTVNTGAVDPLKDVAAIARRHGLWMHVDGAFGALAAMAVPERFEGLALADSLSMDAHKWLYQPVDCGVLLYREAAAARRAFSFSGDYVRTLSTDSVEGFAFFDESLELSRRARALKPWLSVRYHGLRAFREAIRKDLENASHLAELVRAEPKLELLAPVPLSAVCFRYVAGLAEPERDAFNTRLMARLNARGRVYLSNATLSGRFALRACFVNHRTTAEDVRTVVAEVLATAKELQGT